MLELVSGGVSDCGGQREKERKGKRGQEQQDNETGRSDQLPGTAGQSGNLGIPAATESGAPLLKSGCSSESRAVSRTVGRAGVEPGLQTRTYYREILLIGDAE